MRKIASLLPTSLIAFSLATGAHAADDASATPQTPIEPPTSIPQEETEPLTLDAETEFFLWQQMMNRRLFDNFSL